MRKHQFKLVLVGSHFSGLIDEDNRHLVETHDWVPFKGHSYRMMCMNLDIAVIPLAHLPFNEYKSSIKFYEMSTMGIPSLVSNILPYKEDVNEYNCVPYDNPQEFLSGLEFLLTNEKARKVIGSQAEKWVRENHGAKENVEKWINAYQSLLQ